LSPFGFPGLFPFPGRLFEGCFTGCIDTGFFEGFSTLPGEGLFAGLFAVGLPVNLFLVGRVDGLDGIENDGRFETGRLLEGIADGREALEKLPPW
jgi:hypothetical protein